MKLRQVLIVATGLGLLGISLYLSGVLSSMKEPPEKKVIPKIKKYAKTATVNYTNLNTEIQAFGRVRTAESLDMIAEVSGRMMPGSVPLKEGQNFKRGALLYRIDDEEARLNLQSQKSNFLRDVAAVLPDLKVDYPGSFDQWNNFYKGIRLDKGLPELPQFKSDKEKTFLATQNIFSNYYTIKSAEARLKKYRFYAPFAGNIYSLNLQKGSFVNAGSNIGRIIRSDKLELKVDVEASEIGWIELGSEAIVYSESGEQWNGKVIRIGDFVNQNTQSIDVFIAIEPVEGQKMFDGQFLKAIMPSKVIPNSMVIPRNVITNGNEVFIIEDTILKTQIINVQKINKETAIVNGLKEGSNLVIEPLINAFNGMTIYKIEEDKDIDIESKDAETKESKLVNN